jgi:hypothetical protein
VQYEVVRSLSWAASWGFEDMRKCLLLALLALPLCFLVGCGPKLQPDDLGEVLFDLSKSGRLTWYYPLPELPPPSNESLMQSDPTQGG